MSVIIPFFVPPEQFYPGPSTTGPERLCRALFEDALCTVARGRKATRYGLLAQQAQLEARRWFLSEDTSWVFSFLNVCDILELDAATIRHVVFSPDLQAQLYTLRTRFTRAHSTKIHTKKHRRVAA